MRIGQKIQASFAGAIAAACAIACIAYVSASHFADQLGRITAEELPSLRALDAIKQSQKDLWVAAYALATPELIAGDLREALFRQASDAQARIEDATRRYEGHAFFEGEEDAWKNVPPLWSSWEEPTKQIVALAKERDGLVAGGAEPGDPRLAKLDIRINHAVRVAQRAYAPVGEQLDRVIELNEAGGSAVETSAKHALSHANRALALVVALVAVVLLAIGTSLTRSIAGIIQALIAEARKLSDAVAKGDLHVRGDAGAVEAEFRGIVDGMNGTMDAFMRPMLLTAEYVGRISRGDLPPRITETYEGDFDAMKESLNGCIDAVNALVADASMLVQSAVAGKLATRADDSKHGGDFKRIVAGVNATLDAVLTPVAEASRVLEQLARRDLRARMTGQYLGDHAAIKEALNATAEALQDAIGQVAETAAHVSRAADQIASSSESVARGASEQASSLEETSMSLESIASVTKSAADAARRADVLAREAKAAASASSSAMHEMTSTMADIKTAAQGTSQIIKDINEIAFQTNLLALNAAVEAARAGEAGRGFAVVAEEVRSLAQRSKEAANRTEALIRESVARAVAGEATAKSAGAKLEEITGAVMKVSDIVGEIASAGERQSEGINQVVKAVELVGRVTQQNAASSEESSSAAIALSGESQKLASMVGTFSTGQDESIGPAADPDAEPARPPLRRVK
jgi:methyl-accepting chemotaxis protein